TLYARGAMTRDELARAARDLTDARTQLEAARGELLRTNTVLAELDARRRLASLPSLRPGQFDAGNGLVRYAGTRVFSPDGGLAHALERHFFSRVGRSLPISASGQTDVHTRLGLDHRNAMDIAVHPDSPEGRLVTTWLREQGVSFLAFSGPRSG